MRENLIILLKKFNYEGLSVEIFLNELEELNKKGIWQHLNPKERKVFNSFFSWYAGMYDPNRPPRTGLVGKFKDTIGQFKGEYRVSLEQLRRRAIEVEREMNSTRQP
jgi:hypothetical protein